MCDCKISFKICLSKTSILYFIPFLTDFGDRYITIIMIKRLNQQSLHCSMIAHNYILMMNNYVAYKGYPTCPATCSESLIQHERR